MEIKKFREIIGKIKKGEIIGIELMSEDGNRKEKFFTICDGWHLAGDEPNNDEDKVFTIDNEFYRAEDVSILRVLTSKEVVSELNYMVSELIRRKMTRKIFK